jgi:acyl transferase domain-containing protein
MLHAALLNNFGTAESNTVVLLEEHVKSSSVYTVPNDMNFMFGLSAKTVVALEELRTKYINCLCSPESVDLLLVDITYTATARHQIYSCRLAISVCMCMELLKKLESAAVMQVQHPSTPPVQAIVVFSRQGSQYLGMGCQLYNDVLLFPRCIDASISLFLPVSPTNPHSSFSTPCTRCSTSTLPPLPPRPSPSPPLLVWLCQHSR